MNNEEIARVCHEANRAFCAAMGDDSHLAWDASPEWQRATCIKGVQFIRDNPMAHPSASHEAWLQVKTAEGWKYGETKDADKKEHPCFLPYDQLPVEQKAKDYIFGAVVRAMLANEDEKMGDGVAGDREAE